MPTPPSELVSTRERLDAEHARHKHGPRCECPLDLRCAECGGAELKARYRLPLGALQLECVACRITVLLVRVARQEH